MRHRRRLGGPDLGLEQVVGREATLPLRVRQPVMRQPCARLAARTERLVLDVVPLPPAAGLLAAGLAPRHGGGAVAAVHKPQLVPRKEQRERRARRHHLGGTLQPRAAERVRRGVARDVDEHAPPHPERLAGAGQRALHGGRQQRGHRVDDELGERLGGVRHGGGEAERVGDAQPAVVVVHRQLGVGHRHRPPLGVVRAEQRARGVALAAAATAAATAVVHRRELPAEVVRVLQPGVGAKGACGRELVRGVAEQVDALHREPLRHQRAHRPRPDRLDGKRHVVRADARRDGGGAARLVERLAVGLEVREVRQLRDPLALLHVVRDEHRHRVRVEREVEHRRRVAQPLVQRRRLEVDRLEVLQRRWTHQREPQPAAHGGTRSVACKHVVRFHHHRLGLCRSILGLRRHPAQLGSNAGAILLELDALIAKVEGGATVGGSAVRVGTQDGGELRLRQVRHLGRRGGLQPGPGLVRHVVLCGYLIAEQSGAVAEVPPLVHGRRLRTHLFLDAELAQQLHRPGVDQVGARVARRVAGALDEQRRHAVA